MSQFVLDLPANKVVILLDTCHSGSATKARGMAAMTGESAEETRALAGLAKACGISVFSAASESQLAYEIRELGYGIFTYCLLDAFDTKPDEISEKGFVKVTRLLGTVTSATRETSYRYLGIYQSPIFFAFGDDFSIGKVE